MSRLFHASRTAAAAITETTVADNPAARTAYSTLELSFKNISNDGVEVGQLLSTHMGSVGHPYCLDLQVNKYIINKYSSKYVIVRQ